MTAAAGAAWAASWLTVAPAALAGAGPAPTPTELPYNPDDVTPGVVGFMFTFVVFVLVALIGWDLLRRVRRVKYREEIRQRLEAEIVAREGAGDAPGAGDARKNSGAGDAPAEPGRDDEDPSPPTRTAD